MRSRTQLQCCTAGGSTSQGWIMLAARCTQAAVQRLCNAAKSMHDTMRLAAVLDHTSALGSWIKAVAMLPPVTAVQRLCRRQNCDNLSQRTSLHACWHTNEAQAVMHHPTLASQGRCTAVHALPGGRHTWKHQAALQRQAPHWQTGGLAVLSRSHAVHTKGLKACVSDRQVACAAGHSIHCQPLSTGWTRHIAGTPAGSWPTPKGRPPSCVPCAC